jgi:uncharacterized OB-fold protein
MILYRCEDCSTSFLEKRKRCYNCRSERLKEYEASSGVVKDTVQLFATPDNLPEKYYILRVESEGISFFCRSRVYIREGEKVSVKEDANSISCEPQRNQL